MVAGMGVLAVVLGVMVWSVPRIIEHPEDPLYGGTPLSQHLYALYGHRSIITVPTGRARTAKGIAHYKAEAQKRMASRNALSLAGAEALPLVTNWLASEPVAWKVKLGERLMKHDFHYPQLTADRRSMGWSFLAEYPIPVAGSELFPHFATVVANGTGADLRNAARVMVRFMHSGKNIEVEAALRALMPLHYRMRETTGPSPLTGFSWPSAHDLESCIELADPQRVFRPLLVLEIGPTPDRVRAARELKDYPRIAARAVPLLIANLGSTNRAVQEHCALALGAYGEKARAALPPLTHLLAHPRGGASEWRRRMRWCGLRERSEPPHV